MNILQLDKDKPASVGQTVPESILGRSLRQAAANPLNPKIAAELIVRAADMIDGLGATLMRANETLNQMSKTAGEAIARADAAEAALEQVEREAVTFFVFAQLTEVQVGSDVRVAVPTDFEGAALLSELDRRFEALRNDAGTDAAALAEIDALRARLATIRATVQTLPLLVQMLEPCE